MSLYCCGDAWNQIVQAVVIAISRSLAADRNIRHVRIACHPAQTERALYLAEDLLARHFCPDHLRITVRAHDDIARNELRLLLPGAMEFRPSLDDDIELWDMFRRNRPSL